MSDTVEPIARDQKNGRFLTGNIGGGRKPGSRSKLAEAFVADLRDAWEKHGVRALERCALDEPAQFLKVIAGLMPRDLNISMTVDATEFVGKFRTALALLGNEAEAPKPRRLREAKVIEHEQRRD